MRGTVCKARLAPDGARCRSTRSCGPPFRTSFHTNAPNAQKLPSGNEPLVAMVDLALAQMTTATTMATMTSQTLTRKLKKRDLRPV